MAKKRHHIDTSAIPRPRHVPPPAPTKFTAETRQKILSAIQNGCFRFQACALAGIGRHTLVAWEKLGAADPESEHGQFLAELERVQFAAEAHLQVIHHALSTGGKLPAGVVAEMTGELGDFRQKALLPALQAQLKYGGSRPWAEKIEVAHTGKDGGAIKIEGGATPEAAAALLREAFGGHARKALEAEEGDLPAVPGAEYSGKATG